MYRFHSRWAKSCGDSWESSREYFCYDVFLDELDEDAILKWVVSWTYSVVEAYWMIIFW